MPIGRPQNTCILWLQTSQRWIALTAFPQPPHIPGTIRLGLDGVGDIPFAAYDGGGDVAAAFLMYSTGMSLNAFSNMFDG